MTFEEWWYDSDIAMTFPNDCEEGAKTAWNTALEEAAKVAENRGSGANCLSTDPDDIAKDIRSLKGE